MTATSPARAEQAPRRLLDRALLTRLRELTRPAPQSLSTRWIHRNLVITADGTWAYYLSGSFYWFGAGSAERDAHLRSQAERWSELVGHRVWLRGLHVPDPSGLWAERMLAEHPGASPGFRELIESAERWKRVEFAETAPALVIGVRLSTRPVPREHLPKVLGEASTSPRLGTIQEVADAYARVSRGLAREGLRASPLSPAGLDWVYAQTRAAGHTLPEPGALDRADGWNAPDIEVRATQGEDEVTVRVRATVDGRGRDRYVRVLRLSASKERDTDRVPPWLSWFAQHPAKPEFAACYDVIHGRDLARNADDRLFHNSNVATEYRRHGVPVDEWTQQGIDRSAAVANDTAHGDPPTATRMWGQVLVAVHGDSEQQALDAADTVASSAAAGGGTDSRGPGLVLTSAPAQWFDYRAMIPGEQGGRFNGHLVRHSARYVAAGVADASPRAGDSSGVPLGNIAGSNGIYTFDPLGGVRRDRAGVWVNIGEQGSGKTSLFNLVAYSYANAGVRTIVSDPSGLMAGLCELPTLRDRSMIVRLGEGEPGRNAPHFLVPEPRREAYEGHDDWLRAVRSAQAERMDHAADAIRLTLPPGMAERDDVQQAIAEAVAVVGGDYGVHPAQIVESLERTGDIGTFVAKQIRAKAVSPAWQALWPLTRDVAESRAFAPLHTDAVLTVVTSHGLTPPPRNGHGGGMGQWSSKQLETRALTHFGNLYASRVIWADRDPKIYLADELSLAAGGESAFTSFLSRLAMDSRKFGCSAGLAMQTATPLTTIDEHASSLIAAGFVGRTSRRNAAATLDAMRLRHDEGWEDVVCGFTRPGQFLVSGWDDLPAIVGVDQFHWPAGLRRVSDTTPVRPAAPILNVVGGIR